jgi:signal transduction histidine kinase/CheY-like chemotaxis protein
MESATTTKEQAEGKVSILLVDDRADKLLALETMLAELNQNLVRATSGREALRCLLNQDFAVILLDVNMPIMDGFETAAMIRQRPRTETTPIIFFSAVNDTETHVSRGYSLGAVDYILSPVVPEILRAKVAVFVDLFKKTEQVKRQAEERAQFIREQAARVEAEVAQKRMSFLAEASNILSASLDYQQTFENLTRIVVPKLADFCIIDTLEENGSLRQVAVAHRDQEKLQIMRELGARYPSTVDKRHGAGRVFVSGKSEICCHMDDAVLNEIFEDETDRHLIRELHPVSYIAVPLTARDRIIGAMTMVNTSAERPCGPSELSLAEELAQRAALALDNASLYNTAQKARIEAERANLAKDQFLAMLSHELRTPLTPVLASVISLEGQELPEHLSATLQMIRRNVELEARLIDDLLDLTRISKGKVHLNLETVDAHLLLRNALEICHAEIHEKELAVSLNSSAEQHHLTADPARLQQIFWNLIKNAVKFTPNGGQITLSTNNDREGNLHVQVADSGQGIEPKFLTRIFDAFEQVEKGRKGGLGLGLAITKTLVEMHNGKIIAESEGHNQGAKFSVCFPAARISDEVPENAAPPAAEERKSSRVLLVEDHKDSNHSLTQMLKRRGYLVESAWDVKSALELAGQHEFDILISDMGLPDGSGIDIMRQIRDRDILGIAISGYGMEEDIQRSHDVGFRHHLVKPVDVNRLDDLIQQMQMGPATVSS